MLAWGQRLEQGQLDGPWSPLLAAAWRLGTAGTTRRRLDWPRTTRVVVVGGATLGGSSKTPVAMACAIALADHGIPTALVGHAYRATPRSARIVSGNEPIDDVGDEALLAARVLRPSGALVVVGPTRCSAVAFAATHAEVLVLDGVSQTAPRRASLAILAVDGAKPWGLRAALPPGGDLCADPRKLIEACDVVVPVKEPFCDLFTPFGKEPPWQDVWPAHALSEGAVTTEGLRWPWEALRVAPVGLITVLARPDRVVRSLAARGVCPRAVLCSPDHGPLSKTLADRAARAVRSEGIALWLATPKCTVHLSAVERPLRLGAPLATLDYSVALDSRLIGRLIGLGAP